MSASIFLTKIDCKIENIHPLSANSGTLRTYIDIYVSVSTMAFSIVKIRPVLDFRGTRDIELNEAQTMPFAYTAEIQACTRKIFKRGDYRGECRNWALIGTFGKKLLYKYEIGKTINQVCTSNINLTLKKDFALIFVYILSSKIRFTLL